jgi:glycosyltransferase involved in cell wall biosynthesis
MLPINYICYAFGSTGYATAARNNILAIHQAGIPIRITAIDVLIASKKIAGSDYKLLKSLCHQKPQACEMNIYHCIPPIQHKLSYKTKGQYNASMVTFEAPEMPLTWLRILENNNFVMVPSQFNYDSFNKTNYSKPVYILPHCIDTQKYNLNVQPMYQYDKFTFMFIGIWRERKGYRELLQAWTEEFKPHEKVQLVIKTDKIDQSKSYVSKMCRNHNNIVFENKIFNEDEMATFIKSAHCTVNASYGEGFSYIPLQSMALGVPVIAPNYSGCKDYLNSEKAYLLKPEGVMKQSSIDRLPQFSNCSWAFYSVPQIRRVLRQVFEEQEVAKEKARQASRSIQGQFDYKNIGEIFRKILKEENLLEI